MAWDPVVNAAAVILVVRPYRRAISELLHTLRRALSRGAVSAEKSSSKVDRKPDVEEGE